MSWWLDLFTDKSNSGISERVTSNDWTNIKEWNDISSATLGPYTAACFRFNPTASTRKVDNCFVNLSNTATSRVQRSYENGRVNSDTVDLSDLSYVDKEGYSGNWNDDIESAHHVHSVPTHEQVCLNGVPTDPWAGMDAYRCPTWYLNNRAQVVAHCATDPTNETLMASDACRWLNQNDPPAITKIRADYCSKPITYNDLTKGQFEPGRVYTYPGEIKSTECKTWMRDPGAPLPVYEKAWYEYCSKRNNFLTADCINHIKNYPNNTYREQFDTLWNQYCATAAGKKDKKCSCFDTDPKWANQPFCFKPDCTNQGYKTRNMERTDCAEVCQSIVAGTAGNNATLTNVDVRQTCTRKGVNIQEAITPTPSQPTPTTPTPAPAQPPTPAPAPAPAPTQPPTPAPETKSSNTGNIIIIIGICLLLAALIPIFFVSRRWKIILGVVIIIALILILSGFALLYSKKEGFQDEVIPEEPVEQMILIKSIVTDKYLSLCYSCNATCPNTLCLSKVPSLESRFVVEQVPESDRIALRNVATGMYLRMCQRCFVNCQYSVCADGQILADPDCQWTVYNIGDGNVALMGNNGLYLKNIECANPCTIEPEEIMACQGPTIDRYCIFNLSQVE